MKFKIGDKVEWIYYTPRCIAVIFDITEDKIWWKVIKSNYVYLKVNQDYYVDSSDCRYLR